MFGISDYILTEEDRDTKKMNNTNELLNTIKVP